MDFVAIDFETANQKRTSACSVGLAFVEHNRIIEQRYFLIKPSPFEFNDINIRVHGITADDVASSPEFLDVWANIVPLIKGKLLIAHNAAFDMSIIRASLPQPWTEFDYLCTMRMAQAVDPNIGCYKLDYLCAKYNIKLNHHNASSDAVACANLFLKLCETMSIDNYESLISKKLIYPGHIHPFRYDTCRRCANDSVRSKPLKTTDPDDFEIIYLDDDFDGKRFVFTGEMCSMSRNLAKKIVSCGGGVVQKNVTSTTNYLVVGIQNPIALKGRALSTKHEKALALANKGQDIQIVYEDDFLKMIDDELLEKF